MWGSASAGLMAAYAEQSCHACGVLLRTKQIMPRRLAIAPPAKLQIMQTTNRSFSVVYL